MPGPVVPRGLDEFQKHLIGRWVNEALPSAPNGEGSQNNPLAYNVMPLPQATPQDGKDYGYILKNCTIYEDTTFNSSTPPPTTAPNRASNSAQLPTAVYYGQKVFFGDGPATGQLVHSENGSWLNIRAGKKIVGPYGPVEIKPDCLRYDHIAKQMSVPHGNSILALGTVEGPVVGLPSIPNSDSTKPKSPEINTSLYDTKMDDPENYQNPIVEWTENPNAPLQIGVQLIGTSRKPVTHYMSWNVSTANNPGVGEMNIPFEEANARVTGYSAQYWLISNDGGITYGYLAYTQTITLRLNINGRMISFAHVTTNLLTKDQTC